MYVRVCATIESKIERGRATTFVFDAVKQLFFSLRSPTNYLYFFFNSLKISTKPKLRTSVGKIG